MGRRSGSQRSVVLLRSLGLRLVRLEEVLHRRWQLRVVKFKLLDAHELGCEYGLEIFARASCLEADVVVEGWSICKTECIARSMSLTWPRELTACLATISRGEGSKKPGRRRLSYIVSHFSYYLGRYRQCACASHPSAQNQMPALETTHA